MKKIIFIITFCLLKNITYSQSYVNFVKGKYLCTRTIMDGTTTVSTCTCHLELYPNSTYTLCVSYQDSCFGASNWDYTTRYILVNSDSTFNGYTPWDCSSCASGKLYPNDSIHLDVHYPVPTTYNYRKIFNGHKLYNNLSVAEMYLPENALIVSPNPASETMYIESVQQSFGNPPPVIYDGAGNKVNVEVNFINSKTYKANVSTLSSGIYFVFIQSSKGYIRQKVIIEH